MATPYIDAATLKQTLSDIYQKADVGTLAVADSTLENAARYGYNEIIDRLTKRGFSKAQVDAWDRRVEFNTQVALWWCFACGGIPACGDDRWVKNFDLRKDLDTVGVFIDDIRVWPDLGRQEDPGGSIGGGRLSISETIPKPRW